MRFTLIILLWSLPLLCSAKNITLIVSGEGNTRQEAINNGLATAVEQAFGTFISANTEILNDELTKDEVISLKRGNVKKYTVLTESGTEPKSVILEVTVSPEKLSEFAVSHGSQCELAGNVYASNLRLDKITLENAIKATEHLSHELAILASNMYDYKLNVGEPKLMDSYSFIPVGIECRLNASGLSFYKTFRQSYSAIKKSIDAVSGNGDYKRKYLNQIDSCLYAISILPKLWCFGFKLKDNIGDSVTPYMLVCKNDSIGHYATNWPQKLIMPILREGHRSNDWGDTDKSLYARNIKDATQYSDYPVYSGYIDVEMRAVGVDVEKLRAQIFVSKNGYGGLETIPYYSYINNLAKKHDPTYPLSVDSFLLMMKEWGSGLLEIPNTPQIKTGQWYSYKLFSAPNRVGDLNGTIHIVLKYPHNKLEKLSGMKIVPLSNIY